MPFESITSQNLKKFGRSYLNKSAKVSLFLKKVYPEPQGHALKKKKKSNSAGSVICMEMEKKGKSQASRWGNNPTSDLSNF